MRIDQMHYQFKLGFDRIDSLDRQDFERWEIDTYLYKGIWLFTKDRYKVDMQTKKGFEVVQSRIDELKTLYIKSPELQPGITPISLGNGVYEIRLNSLGHNINGQYFRYLFYIDSKILAKKDECTKYMGVTLKQSDDRLTIFSDADWKWRRILGNFGKSTFEVNHLPSTDTQDEPDVSADLIPANNYLNDELGSFYLDTKNKNGQPQFEIEKVYVSYLKYPNRVFIGGYDHIDGMSSSTSPQIHCDIDEAFHDEIIRLAVQLAHEDLLDPAGIQVSNKKTLADKL